MKKYLPSLDELIPGVIVLLVGLTVWSIVSPYVAKVTSKIPSAA